MADGSVVQNYERARLRNPHRLLEIVTRTFVGVIAIEIDVAVLRITLREEVRRTLNMNTQHVAQSEAGKTFRCITVPVLPAAICHRKSVLRVTLRCVNETNRPQPILFQSKCENARHIPMPRTDRQRSL